MCEKCVAIGGKIEHYRNLSSLITDRRTLEAIELLIDQLQAEKQELHAGAHSCKFRFEQSQS